MTQLSCWRTSALMCVITVWSGRMWIGGPAQPEPSFYCWTSVLNRGPTEHIDLDCCSAGSRHGSENGWMFKRNWLHCLAYGHISTKRKNLMNIRIHHVTSIHQVSCFVSSASSSASDGTCLHEEHLILFPNIFCCYQFLCYPRFLKCYRPTVAPCRSA